jgi:hypothetical protein
MVPAIIAGALFQGVLAKLLAFGAAMLVLLPFMLRFRAQKRSILRDAPPAENPLTWSQAHRSAAASFPKGRLVASIVLCAIFALVGALAMWVGAENGDNQAYFAGLGSRVLFGAATGAGVFLWHKRAKPAVSR